MSSKIGIIVMVIYFVTLYMSCIYYDYQCVQLKEQIENKQSEIVSIQNELATTKNDLQLVTEDSEELNAKLKNVTIVVNDLKDTQYTMVYLGEFKLTHYCTENYAHICGTGDGLTATGTLVTAGRTIAVDPSIIPYGAQVYIEGYGWRVAEDCGGAVNGNHIDIAVDSHEQAINTGTTNGGVWILVQ